MHPTLLRTTSVLADIALCLSVIRSEHAFLKQSGQLDEERATLLTRNRQLNGAIIKQYQQLLQQHAPDFSEASLATPLTQDTIELGQSKKSAPRYAGYTAPNSSYTKAKNTPFVLKQHGNK